MSENFNDLDAFLSIDANRKELFDYFKTSPSNHNLLTLYLLLRCFKSQNNTDPLKLKQISDRTYKTCIIKHEHEIEQILGSDYSHKLTECLKSGVYNESFLEQVSSLIKKVLDKEFVKFELKHDRTLTKSRASSSTSSGLGSKSGSSLSLNQIPNPYHVKTKAIKAPKHSDTQSLVDTRRNKKSSNSSLKKVRTKVEQKNLKLNLTELTFQLEKLEVTSSNIDTQLDAHLEHVSRTKFSKSKNNQSMCQNVSVSKTNLTSFKTTVAYYMPGETLAYLTTFNGREITLSQFKHLITKRGNYRYFFKTKTDLLEEDCVVFQEITDDQQVLPKFNEKIIAKIELN